MTYRSMDHSKLTRSVWADGRVEHVHFSEKELSSEEDGLSCYIENSKIRSKNSVVCFFKLCNQFMHLYL